MLVLIPQARSFLLLHPSTGSSHLSNFCRNLLKCSTYGSSGCDHFDVHLPIETDFPRHGTIGDTSWEIRHPVWSFNFNGAWVYLSQNTVGSGSATKTNRCRDNSISELPRVSTCFNCQNSAHLALWPVGWCSDEAQVNEPFTESLQQCARPKQGHPLAKKLGIVPCKALAAPEIF